MIKLRILVTNDDGVYAEGLQTLWRVLLHQLRSDDEVYVVAPERERSAVGHAITLHKPLHVNEISFSDGHLPIWSVSGNPADCTKIGVEALLPAHPDLVISGINRGANLGMDVLYSGTVSAAIEGVILGIPSIAVSLAAWENPDYTYAAKFVAGLVERHRRDALSPSTLLNVNVPAIEEDKIAGVAATRLGVRRYRDVFHRREDPRGRTYYWLAGEPIEEGDPGTDVDALASNMVSVTPLRLQLTEESQLPTLDKWLHGDHTAAKR